MLVLYPDALSLGVAVLAIALVVPMSTALREKQRVSEGLKLIPGPKGWPLLGMLPDIIKHAPRVHEYFVRPPLLLKGSCYPLARSQG